MATLSRILPLVVTCAAGAAHAEPVRLELNALHPRDGACQMVFVAQNDSETDLQRLVLEAVLFDAGGQVAALTLLDLQDLPAARMRVRSFEIAGLACDNLSRLLVNGVSACEPDSAVCAEPLALESRVPVEVLQ
ncbi:hypothetical protein [Pararhodobacter sp. CCB-MM2]|uniref:hypothetical protein n=1 Tax=Pararhodobacter sp. CCB-MM2 TaxID=1786003 RepID=UPI000834281F|nr:hypothetical protein [Pararhodobacter sp. CCB-MM2]MCA2014031.1 hypothetical protein [Cereibacter sphaeroides]